MELDNVSTQLLNWQSFELKVLMGKEDLIVTVGETQIAKKAWTAL